MNPVPAVIAALLIIAAIAGCYALRKPARHAAPRRDVRPSRDDRTVTLFRSLNAERRAAALLDALHREPVWTVALRAAPAGWEHDTIPQGLPALPFATAVWGGSPRQVADQLAALIFSNDGARVAS